MTAPEHAQQQPSRPSPFAVLTAAVFAVLLLLFVHSVAEVLLLLLLATLFSLYLGGIGSGQRGAALRDGQGRAGTGRGETPERQG